ncbi:MAG: 2-C-methyl-D-erythritol 2,4-cyclodiphosphate synthase [Proteobacteria bacterium]|nr:MAG: 2-C-methyl-D-erythritol 2,4-cyclodiphosphate synthase [Pseudomonadota bacterium]
MRVGLGFDVHAFGEGDHLMVGNVRIPFDRGFVAHSDGDVLIHAVCDALLGALSLGDIGDHFPPSDPKWADCDSAAFLRHCLQLVQQAGYQIVNIDTVIMVEQPKIGPYKVAIQDKLAKILNLKNNQISVKATTTEKLGFVGREEGMAAQAICLLTAVDNF